MKKLILIATIIITASASVFAQQDKDARIILNALSKKYRAYKALKTDFSVTVNNKQAGYVQTQTGVLFSDVKGNKFHISLYEPAAKKAAITQEIISDGKTQWTYLVDEKEVQVNDAGQGDQGFNPAQIFTIYEKGYKYVYTGLQKQNGVTCQVIELSPEAENAQYFKLRLFVDKAKKQIHSLTAFDKGGNSYTYTLKTLTPNPPVAPAFYSFDAKKYPGVEVVDLR